MALTVVSFAAYLTRPPWSDSDRNALKFVKAIKGESFKYSANVPVNGVIRRLTISNAADVVDWFGDMAAAEIRRLKLSAPLVLIPLPNSSSTVKNQKVPRTALLATTIAGKLKNTVVCDCMRWKKPQIPTHDGGPREAHLLYPNLALTTAPPKGNILLIDDVHTLGGHLQAAAARLVTDANRTCKTAMAAGRSVLVSESNPFLVIASTLAYYTPNNV